MSVFLPAVNTYDAEEIETGPNPIGSVIWLHGLGADGHDFVPIVPELGVAGDAPLRFVFPHAPVRPVTLNGGYPMRAWYDLYGLDRRAREDEDGMRASSELVETFIAREADRGIAAAHVVLAGFSQGGAMALYCGLRHESRLAGLIALSCYLPLAQRLAAERATANRNVPIFMAHGAADPVVPFALGTESRSLLTAAGYTVDWHEYPMPHSVSSAEVAAIGAWLRAHCQGEAV